MIIDRRKNSKGKSAANRKRFLDRYKEQIRRAVDDAIDERSIEDSFDAGDITIDEQDLTQPTFGHDPKTGNKDRVLPGNKKFIRGDIIQKPESGEGQGCQGSPDGEGDAEFTFTLTKEEFINLYFKDLCLPSFVKQSLKDSVLYKRKKAGYSKEGIPARLSLKKSFEQSIGRRIAAKAQGKENPRRWDDTDLRYDYYVQVPQPNKTAVMFCLMDVSGSMGETEKLLAKKFYILLFLFLKTQYDTVEVRFVKHHTVAFEVDEKDFFYSRETGGTVVSTGLQLINEIIDNEYNLSTTNIYIAQCSDGDNWGEDDQTVIDLLKDTILPKTQYYVYLQVEDEERHDWKVGHGSTDLFDVMEFIGKGHPHLKVERVFAAADIYPALRELFKKEGVEA